MMDQRLLRRKGAADQNRTEPNRMPKQIQKREVDLWHLQKLKNQKIHRMMSRHQQLREEEVDLKDPKRRLQLLKQRVGLVKEEVEAGHVKKQHLLKRMQPPLRRNKMKMKKKKKKDLTSKHSCF